MEHCIALVTITALSFLTSGAAFGQIIGTRKEYPPDKTEIAAIAIALISDAGVLLGTLIYISMAGSW